MKRLLPVALAIAVASCTQFSQPPNGSGPARSESGTAYTAEINSWRAKRDAELRKTDGWLTLVGLYWLHPGPNTAGSGPENDLVFPKSAPTKLGTFILSGDKVRFRAAPGAGISQEGKPVTTVTLDPFAADGPVLEFGSFGFHALERAGQIGIRLRDHDSPARAAFAGMENFPVESSWRITARFERHDEPVPIKVPNIVGTAFDELVYGKLVFEVGGAQYSLDPLYKPEDGFFVIFADDTNGRETYGGGRFLATDPPSPEGAVILDFNKAYNPPCVFTPYATCPLPPAQNRLPFRIEAGEMMYRAGLNHGH